jgi:quercetin dioxygenase-like cupin family protein
VALAPTYRRQRDALYNFFVPLGVDATLARRRRGRDAVNKTSDDIAHGNYAIERLLEGGVVRASLVTLAPGQQVPPHHHSDVTDHIFVVEGELTIEFHDTKDRRTFAPESLCTIRPSVIHATKNESQNVCKFLLVQLGRFDFVEE